MPDEIELYRRQLARERSARQQAEALIEEKTLALYCESQARARSEERYRDLFDCSPLPMWVYDCETLAFLAVNQAAIEHYGYSRAEFAALTIKDIRPPDDVAELLASAAQPAPGIERAGI